MRDDDGHALQRGQRMAVCDKTFGMMTDPAGPYAKDIIAVPPQADVALETAGPFDCRGSTIRHPRETKGQAYDETRLNDGRPGCNGAACC